MTPKTIATMLAAVVIGYGVANITTQKPAGISDANSSTLVTAADQTLTVKFGAKQMGDVLCWGKNGPGRRNYGYIWVAQNMVSDRCLPQ